MTEPAPEAPDVLILAGGGEPAGFWGRPKGLVPVLFRPLIAYAIESAKAVASTGIRLVVDAREYALPIRDPAFEGLPCIDWRSSTEFASLLREEENLGRGRREHLLIVSADAVLLTPETLAQMIALHRGTGASCTAAKGSTEDPATVAFCFRKKDLSDILNSSRAGRPLEAALFATAAQAIRIQGGKCIDFRLPDPDQGKGIGDFEGLWRAEGILQARVHRKLMSGGVSLQNPLDTVIDAQSRIEAGVRIHGGTSVIASRIAAGATIDNHCRIENSTIGASSRIKQGSMIANCRIGGNCAVGPNAVLRGGTVLENAVRVGNAVELDNASLGTGSRVARLSFIRDAQIGKNVNIGAGFITCSSRPEGLSSHTQIDNGVFIGGGSTVIAPVAVGAGSFVATGTVVTDDVPPDSFVISRGRQVTRPGYSKKLRKIKAAN